MKTERSGLSRPAKAARLSTGQRLALLVIIALATALRLWHIDFGLPALNDPDEPLFVMTALDMLREHRLNPEWFGHPATMLFYALAMIFAAIGWAGTMVHQWSDAAGFASAIYADPAIAILPMRLFIMATGIGCVWLTWCIGREAAGTRVGLIAAALLACNGLHVELSQVIRTDMLASLFMLWSSLYAMRAARGRTLRNMMLAGLFVGLGGATKWPAMLFAINGGGAVLHRWRQAGWRRSVILLPLVPIVAIVALLAASPYLLIDHATVLRDLGGEARPVHPGSTGGSFGQNLLWYGRHVLLGGFGLAGALLAAIGLALMPRHARTLALAGLPGALLFLAGIAAQSLVWERWAVPVLPWIALSIAIGLDSVIGYVPDRRRSPATLAAMCLLLAPMLHETVVRSAMRANDTRQLASQWVRAHVAPETSLLIEDAAFDLLARPGPLLFPLGHAGCIDVHDFLKDKPDYRQVGQQRSGKAIVDLGHVDPSLLPGCRTDIAIITHYDRYRREERTFPAQAHNYRTLLARAQVLATFRPVDGVRGGPVTQVVQLAPSPQPTRSTM